ncbi:MAG TPA: hypothetical protein VNG35_16470 [Gemmatimonadales bacterium]|nr:hypothetical protein [Gemmatimonadales bacterium]
MKRKEPPALDYKLLTTKPKGESAPDMMARLLAVRTPVRALCKSVPMAALVDCLAMQKATAVSIWRPRNKGQPDAEFRLLMVDEKTYAEVLEYFRTTRHAREATPADFGAGDA